MCGSLYGCLQHVQVHMHIPPGNCLLVAVASTLTNWTPLVSWVWLYLAWSCRKKYFWFYALLALQNFSTFLVTTTHTSWPCSKYGLIYYYYINYIIDACVCIIFLHPSLRQGMRLYLVWDSEGISETTDTVVEDIFQCVDDSDSEAPRKKSLVKRKREPSSSTKSSKESSEEESASSSDRKAFRCDIIYSIIILYEEEWLASTACHCLEISQWNPLAWIRLQVVTVCIS